MTPSFKHSRIIGTGSYLPERVLSNTDLAAMVDTTDEWIVSRTGIAQRHLAADDQLTSDLAYQAALRALAAAQIDAQSLDLILVATTTPDMIFPSTACILQQKLGAHGFPAFDVQAVCSGFIYALVTADAYIRAGLARRVLVVGAETLSRLVDWQDRGTCVLFGDGAGAVVLEGSDEPGLLAAKLHADGRELPNLQVPARPVGGELQGHGTVLMDGQAVFKFAVQALGDVAEEVLHLAGLPAEQVDWLVPHQANIRIIQATAKRMSLPMSKVVLTVAQHGNTSAASIPLALDVAVRDGRIQPGQTLVLEGIGGGFAWGAVALRWQAQGTQA